MSSLAVEPRSRYDVDLTADQRRALQPQCDWEGWCQEATIGVRLYLDGQRWASVCADHIRMGTTVVIGLDRVRELVEAAG